MAIISAVFKSMRPSFLVLSPICVLLGIAVAVFIHGSINLSLALLVMVGALAAHISVNTFNEYFDFTSGLDEITQKTPFSGGSGSLPAFPAAKNAVLIVALISLFITIGIGFYLLKLTGPILLPIGIVGVVLIVAYTRWINRFPILCLLAPGTAFGFLVVVGTYLSVTTFGQSTMNGLMLACVVSLVPFFLVNNLLLLNQYPDIEADRQVGRKTFPIVYGKIVSTRIYLLFIFGSGVSILTSVVLGMSHWLIILALIPLLGLGIHIYRGLQRIGGDIDLMLPYMGKNVALVLTTNFILASLILVSTTLV